MFQVGQKVLGRFSRISGAFEREGVVTKVSKTGQATVDFGNNITMRFMSHGAEVGGNEWWPASIAALAKKEG
jgi:hypothetical protein